MDSKETSQAILKEISPGVSLEGLMLKLQFSGHLMGRADSPEKTLMLVELGGSRRRLQQRMRCLDDIIGSVNMSLCKFQEIVKDK